MTSAALTISRLSIRDRAGVPLVDEISLEVPRGGALILIGETGSGKSLIAQAVFGLLPSGLRASGTIAVGERGAVPAADAASLAALWHEQTMLIPQEPSTALDPTMRVGRQMALAGIDDHGITGALSAVDLPHSAAAAFPFEMSGGMKQRVLVATALGVGSPIVVADEPTKGLDAHRVEQAIALLRRLVDAGRTLMVITHDRRVAEGLPGRLAIIRDGRIVEQGDGAAVLAAPTSEYGRTWLAADPRYWPRCGNTCDPTRLALSAHGLAFGWPGRPPLFRELDLHLPHGGVLAITGASGCGKTTLGDILLGLRRPLSGSVEWGGVDIVADPRAVRTLRRRYQKLHQDPVAAFVPGMVLSRQFRFLQEVRPGLDVARDLPPLLERLRVDAALLARRPEEISGGEAQRLALARILLLDPVAIVADEPTSRLDPVVQRDTMLLLRAFVDEHGLGLVLISHDQSLVRAVADKQIDLTGHR